ncbi:MAG: hypothetical protein JKY37_25065 [Nannocystaceae bacterium]|nr:hypothetical protein [Nannocystaceae bacterium]
MATHFGTGLIESRGDIKLVKLEKVMDAALRELGFTQLFAGKDGPEEEPEEATKVELLTGADGIVAIRIAEAKPVRDVARIVSEQSKTKFHVLITSGALYHRRSVQVECRVFAVDGAQSEELEIVGHHTAEVKDIEHNELRALDNAMRARINSANDSLLAAEGTADLKVKKNFRYKLERKKPKFSNARLARLLGQLENCESFEVTREMDQPCVKMVLPGNTVGRSFLKDEELVELEKALQTRPELAHRRVDPAG